VLPNAAHAVFTNGSRGARTQNKARNPLLPGQVHELDHWHPGLVDLRLHHVNCLDRAVLEYPGPGRLVGPVKLDGGVPIGRSIRSATRGQDEGLLSLSERRRHASGRLAGTAEEEVRHTGGRRLCLVWLAATGAVLVADVPGSVGGCGVESNAEMRNGKGGQSKREGALKPPQEGV
jgi:hypothetical protein